MWYEHCQVFFVMHYQPLGSHPTVTRFLKRNRNWNRTCGVNTARSSLSCIINSLGSNPTVKGFLIQNPLHQDTHDHGTLTRYFATLGQYINRRIYHYGT